MSSEESSFTPRPTCDRCRRPTIVCYCAHITPIETRTRVVILQHPRERDMPIGTARMASLCLPNATLEVGVEWEGSKALAKAVSDPTHPAVLLYPGEGAIDVTTHPPEGPVTLIVVDGTWRQAQKLVHINPALAALPRYSFTPAKPSEYRIRKEPEETYVSTIEALVYVLGALEGEPARFQALLNPFRAMIEAQLHHEAASRHTGSRHRLKERKPKPPRVPELIANRFDDVVCVVGEANAWPYRPGKEPSEYPDELVHWVAHRIATGETFEALATPRQPLAAKTPEYVRLSAEQLAAGGTLEDLQARWKAFMRTTDVICSWGSYGTKLFRSEGGYLPQAAVDLRTAARVLTSSKYRAIDEYLGMNDIPDPASLASGRAGVRLAQIVAVAKEMRARALSSEAERDSSGT